MSNSRVTILEEKKARNTQKSQVAHNANAIAFISLHVPWLPPLLLQESSYMHEHKTSTEIARIQPHSNELCYLMFASYFMIFLHMHVILFHLSQRTFYMHVEHIHIRPFHSHSRHKCKILSMKAQAINYVVSERKAMFLRPTAILFHC